MANHIYDTYTKSRIESFIPFARACTVFLALNISEKRNKLQNTDELYLVLKITQGLIDLLLSPRLLSTLKYSDLRAKVQMDMVEKRLESTLTRSQLSIAKDYPAILLVQ